MLDVAGVILAVAENLCLSSHTLVNNEIHCLQSPHLVPLPQKSFYVISSYLSSFAESSNTCGEFLKISESPSPNLKKAVKLNLT